MQTAEISLETRGAQVFDLTAEAASFCRQDNPHRRVRLSFVQG